MGALIKKLFSAFIPYWTDSALFHAIDRRISAKARKRLKNDHFSILCSNCIGGIIYHRLGKQFLSPTINMFIREPDFVEFCVHLDYYLAQKLRFIKANTDYPVGQLQGDGDQIPSILLHFNHDKSPEAANANWEKRKKRLVRDNMYIILYNLSGVTEEELKKLESVPCNNKVVFTASPLKNIPWSFCIKPVESHKYAENYLEKDLFGVRYFEKKFDYVRFLNQK